MGENRNAVEAKINRVLNMLDASEVDRIVGERNEEWRAIAEAAMAWQVLLTKGLNARRDSALMRLLTSSLLVLGTLIKYTYALGIRRGRGMRDA